MLLYCVYRIQPSNENRYTKPIIIKCEKKVEKWISGIYSLWFCFVAFCISFAFAHTKELIAQIGTLQTFMNDQDKTCYHMIFEFKNGQYVCIMNTYGIYKGIEC